MRSALTTSPLLAVLAVLAVLAAACAELPPDQSAPPPMRPTDPPLPVITPPATRETPEALAADFAANIAPILGGADGRSGFCGFCHARSGGIGPAFLVAAPDMLTTALAYPGLIGRTPELSSLVTKGTHQGPAFMPADLRTVATWIVRWNARQLDMPPEPPPPPPGIEPFGVMTGTNRIELGAIDPSLEGQAIIIHASLAGDIDPTLVLTAITVHAADDAGVHLVHPLWTIWDADGRMKPDPADSFSNLDQTIPAGGSELLGPGILFLPHFDRQDRLGLTFQLIEARRTFRR